MILLQDQDQLKLVCQTSKVLGTRGQYIETPVCWLVHLLRSRRLTGLRVIICRIDCVVNQFCCGRLQFCCDLLVMPELITRCFSSS